MVCCCVVGCSNNSKRDKKLSFHSFPNKEKWPEVYNRWLDQIKREYFIPSVYARVCSVHFTKDDYKQSVDLRKKLMPDYKVLPILNETAVPSLYMTTSSGKISPPPKKRCPNYVHEKGILNFLLQSDVSIPSTSKGTNRSLRLLYNDAYASNSDTDSSEENVDRKSKSFTSTSTENKRNCGIQCELGMETFRNHCVKGVMLLDRGFRPMYDLDSDEETESG